MEIGHELIKQCKKGKAAAESQLFRTLYASMYRLCRRYVGKHDDAEDCLMKGFIKLFKNLDTFVYSNDGAFINWVKRIMVNESLGHLRQQSVMLYTEDEMVDISIDPNIFEKIETEELYELIMALPKGYRIALNLYIIEGYSHAEIGSMLGISEVTSRTQLAKAKAKLKAMLEQQNIQYAK